MYAALAQDGRLMYADDAQDNGNDEWWCPKCHQPVQLIIRRHGRAYFRHKRKDTFSHFGESEMHLLIKQQFVDYFNRHNHRIELEYSFLPINRIADLVLVDQKLIIEIQHTPISITNIKQRTLSYQQIGYQCIWLLTPILFNLSLNHYWQYALLQYHPQLGYFRLIYNPSIQKIIIQWQLALTNIEKLTYFEYRGNINWLVNFRAKSIQMISDKVSVNISRKKYDYINRIMTLRKSYANSELLNALYHHGYTLHSLPEWILTQNIHLRGFSTPSWMVLAWVWLQSELTQKSLKSILLQLVHNQQIIKYDMPFVSTDQWLQDISIAIANLFDHFGR